MTIDGKPDCFDKCYCNGWEGIHCTKSVSDDKQEEIKNNRCKKCDFYWENVSKCTQL